MMLDRGELKDKKGKKCAESNKQNIRTMMIRYKIFNIAGNSVGTTSMETELYPKAIAPSKYRKPPQTTANHPKPPQTTFFIYDNSRKGWEWM